MARLFIHAGTGKTGTSAIQTSLLKNREELVRQGIRYIQSNQPRPELYGKHKFRWRRRQHPDWDVLRQEAAELAGTDDTVIVTNETLWKKNEEELQFFKECFAGYDFKVLLYVREQVEYLNSRALQASKQDTGRKKLDFRGQETPKDLDRFLNEFLAEVDYLETASRWERVFGKGSVEARLYDRKAFSSGNVVEDFYESVGADVGRLDLRVEANPSLSVPYASILDERESFLSADLEQENLLEMALRLSKRRTTNPKKILSANQAESIRKAFAESNRELFERYVVNAEKFSYGEYDEGQAYNLRELAGELEELVKESPLIPMLAPSPALKKWFQEGWRFDENGMAIQEDGTAVIRFRFHLLKGHWLEGEFGAVLSCGNESVKRDVWVNDQSLGSIDLTNSPIVISRGELGVDDSVEIKLSAPSEESSSDLRVSGIRFEIAKS